MPIWWGYEEIASPLIHTMVPLQCMTAELLLLHVTLRWSASWSKYAMLQTEQLLQLQGCKQMLNQAGDKVCN